jgi:hypothetical protein
VSWLGVLRAEDIPVTPTGLSSTNVKAALEELAAGGGALDAGLLSLLTRPTETNAEDDQFNAGSLDAKWGDWGTPTTNLSDMEGWLKVTNDDYGGVVQAVPAGDWTIEGEFLLSDLSAAAYAQAGLLLTDSATRTGSANSAFAWAGVNNSLTQTGYGFQKRLDDAFVSTYFEALWTTPPGGALHFGLRVTKSGSTFSVFYSSGDNLKTWAFVGSTGALGFTPTHFGLAWNLSAGGFCNYFVRR